MIAKVFKWASAYLRLFFWKLRLGSHLQTGKRVYVGKRCYLSGNIRLDDGVYLSDDCVLQAEPGSEICVGARTFMNIGCKVFAMEQIKIGKDTMFGPNVSVYDHDHDISRGVKYASKTFSIKPVSIGDYVWCGANVVVAKGSSIDCNCVVGAGAVVCGKLEGNGLYTGVPAVRKKDIPND